jgi:uncharacterized iron-regulated membrane protein
MVRSGLIRAAFIGAAVANAVGLVVFLLAVRATSALVLSVTMATLIGIVSGVTLHLHYRLEDVPGTGERRKSSTRTHRGLWAVVLLLLLFLYALQFVPFIIGTLG